MSSTKVQPVGIVEIAAHLGVAQNTVSQWRIRPATHFPDPKWTVSGAPAWNLADIEKWARKTGRLSDEMVAGEKVAAT